MFKELNEINARPTPFQFYTADELWTNVHTSKQMLGYHLNESIDVSSRNKHFIERSVEWIVSRFGVNNKTHIADFGCGPGLYTTKLAQRDASVTGIDFSGNSLTYAREIADQKRLRVNYVLANYLNFETIETFDLIMMIMCDFCALSPVQRKQMLTKFSTLLSPGGAVLLDVYSLNSFHQKKELATYEFNQLDGFWSPNDYYCFVNTFKYDKEKVTLDKHTIIEASQTRVVYNWLQHFSVASLKEEFEKNGFSIKDIYSDVAGTPYEPEAPEFAVIAVRS